MLQDRLVNVLNMNETHIIGGGMWYLEIWWSEPVVGRKRSYHLWHLATKPLFAPPKHKKGASSLTGSSSSISYTLATKSKSKSARPSKAEERNCHLHLIPETLDTNNQFNRCHMNCLCQNCDLGSSSWVPAWSPQQGSGCTPWNEFGLILAGNSSPFLLFPSSYLHLIFLQKRILFHGHIFMGILMSHLAWH